MIRSIRLVLPCNRPRPGVEWGDWFFGRSLAAALTREGFEVSFDFQVRGHLQKWWKSLLPGADIDLVIRGKRAYRPTARPYLIWLISQPDTVTDEELFSAKHVFVASEPYSQKLKHRGVDCSFLPQCTDPAIFRPFGPTETVESDFLFVGNRRKFAPRPVVDLAIQAGLELHVWGRGWDGLLDQKIWQGPAIPNEQLGRHYAGANVVLNDHTQNMLAEGFASNRVFDVLATETPLLTEDMEGLPDVVQEFAFLYNAETFLDCVENARSAHRNARKIASEQVLAAHTFDARAKDIVKVLKS